MYFLGNFSGIFTAQFDYFGFTKFAQLCAVQNTLVRYEKYVPLSIYVLQGMWRRALK